MKAISINTARVIGNQSEAQRLAILAIDDEYRYNVTTWGKTRSDCRAMRRWAEVRAAFDAWWEQADPDRKLDVYKQARAFAKADPPP